jgi:hypothetical protein
LAEERYAVTKLRVCCENVTQRDLRDSPTIAGESLNKL